jgi:nucleotide-binding universal stress UspA family protein
MMSKINKILYATDLSENSRIALTWAFLLAQTHDATVVLFHCVDAIPQGREGVIKTYLGGQRWQTAKAALEKEAASMLKIRVEQFCDENKNKIDSCPFLLDDVVVTRGYAINQIIRAAEERECDIVVMGTHNSRKIYQHLMGSTAQRLIQRSGKPVFVVPL